MQNGIKCKIALKTDDLWVAWIGADFMDKGNAVVIIYLDFIKHLL